MLSEFGTSLLKLLLDPNDAASRLAAQELLKRSGSYVKG